MASFLDLLNSYAIWFYILGVVGILFGIKMLVDSRRLARTTMFTLEQEQAGDKAFRAILVMVVFMALIGAVSLINAFLAPARPSQSAAVAKQTTISFTPPVFLPTSTPVPTLTPEAATPTETATPSRAAQLTNTPGAAATATPVPDTPPPAVTTTPQPPSGLVFPKPALNAPVPNDHISSNRIQFIWGQDQLPQQLPENIFYRVTVLYTDRASNRAVSLNKCIQSSSVDNKMWGQPLSDAKGAAVNYQYSWSVIVVQVPSGIPSDCDGGAGSPLSPASDTRIFYWQ